MLASLFVPAGLVLTLDQASKAFVLSLSDRSPRVGLLRLTRGRVALGLVRGRRALVLLWGLTLVCTGLLAADGALFGSSGARFGLGAALGGASGNLLDMLRRGAVVDFVDLRVWPVFNLADAAIVSGAAVALFSLA